MTPESAIEPPLDSLAREILNDSMRLTTCVRGKANFCCEYHDGMEDGMWMLLDRIEDDADD